MKMKTKAFLLLCLMLCALLVISGCAEKSIYEEYDEEGFSVSVRFDANGGTMMTQVTAIVDTFNISGMKTNSDGEVEIALLDPTDDRRGSGNVCTPSYAESGYYLAGWYAERTEDPDGEGYIYAKPWNFETDRVHVDPNESFSASEPVITLYALWQPLLQVEVYDRATNTLIDTLSYDPTQEQLRMPEWKKDSAKGAIDMNDMPEMDGYTFQCAYYDAEGTKPVDTDVLIHTAEENPDATTMQLYVDWLEGDWYHIYTAKQLVRSADEAGHYVICADLDFSNSEWPDAFMYGKFTGSIQTLDGAQCSISNITAAQERDKTNAGLFGWITGDAVISNITFDNVSFTIAKGSVKTCYFGLFSGSISDDAKLSGVQITNGQLLIDGNIVAGKDAPYSNYVIGLICADGNPDALTYSGISCAINGGSSDKFTIDVDGNTVTITAL